LDANSCGGVLQLTGSLLSTGSNTTVTVFLSVDSAPMVAVGQITGTDFVGDGRFKVANFALSVHAVQSVVLSFVQSGSGGRLTKSFSTTALPFCPAP
jgi:hypothetical protein